MVDDGEGGRIVKIYNTLSRTKELFEPVTPGKVTIYVCGPTVYKDSHIGHAVGPVIFDALKKYLMYKGYQVKLVVNVTDVDDKLIAESQRRDMSMADLAAEVSAGYFDALEKLGVDGIDATPCATDNIDAIIALVQRLAENDAAYAVDGDVYFDISRCKDYGKLSNRKIDDQRDTTRDLAGSGKRNPGDFALWKKVGHDDPIGWDSPWGRGRPGWHIECSAMSMAQLGQTIDIHGGGMDLIFPHHENEIAQSETATGKPFAKYWMHNGLTRIATKAAGGEWKNEKMSKSLGNIRTLKDILGTWPGQTIRFFLLSTHYRRPIDFSDASLTAVEKGLATLYRFLDRVGKGTDSEIYTTASDDGELGELGNSGDAAIADLAKRVSAGKLRYLEALDDDFNTAAALAVLFELARAGGSYLQEHGDRAANEGPGRDVIVQTARMLAELGQIIGVLTGPPARSTGGDDALTAALMQLLIDLRAEARAEKNYALGDVIRDRLAQLNISLKDNPDKTTEWVVGDF